MTTRKTLSVLTAAVIMAFSMAAMGISAETKGQKAAPKAQEAGKYENAISFPLQVTFKKPAAIKMTHFGDVKFNHAQHFQVACDTCHHTWDGKGQPQGCASTGCHDNFTGADGSLSYFNAFHSRDAEQSCVGCHKRKVADGSKKLTTMPCHNNTCHVLKTASK